MNFRMLIVAAVSFVTAAVTAALVSSLLYPQHLPSEVTFTTLFMVLLLRAYPDGPQNAAGGSLGNGGSVWVRLGDWTHGRASYGPGGRGGAGLFWPRPDQK